MTFANVENQLQCILRDVLPFLDLVGRCAEWWSTIRADLEILKDALPQIIIDRKGAAHLVRGWTEVADQFALYGYRVSEHVTDTSTAD
jgi:hypothetical protein